MRVTASWPRPDVCLVRLAGELDMRTAPLVRDDLRMQSAAGPAHLVLDLTAVDLIAAAGISLLVMAMRNEQGIRGRLLVDARSEGTVLRILRLTGVAALLPVRHGVAEALDDVDATRRD